MKKILIIAISCLVVIGGGVTGFLIYNNTKACEHDWSEWEVMKEAKCTKNGYKERQCNLCGEFEDEDIIAPGHNGENVKCGERLVCSVCNEVFGDLKEHDWVEATCDSPKHCTSCNKTEGSALRHNYVDNVCTLCGKELTCDLIMDNQDVIDLKELGACGGALMIAKCDCGEHYEFNSHLVNEDVLVCDFNYDAADIYFGNISYQKLILTCDDCGLKIDVKAEVNDSDDDGNFFGTATISIGDIIVCENISFSTEKEMVEHNGKSNEINLSEYSNCGGTIKYTYCNDCSINILTKNEINCNITYSDEVESIDSKTGIKHLIKEAVCSDCGLSFIVDNYIEGVSDCLQIRYEKYTIKNSDNVIIEFVEKTNIEKHEYNKEYFLLGSECIDGGYSINHCINCDYKTIEVIDNYDGKYYDIHPVLEDVEINLTEKGICTTTIKETRCATCKEQLSYIENSYCNFLSVPSSDKNIKKYVCSNCHVEKIITVSSFSDTCYTIESEKVEYILDGKVIYLFEAKEEDENHLYLDFTYELIGDSCEDGVNRIYRCVKCDDTYSEYYDDRHIHSYSESVDYSEFDVCENHNFVYNLCICGLSNYYTFDNHSYLYNQNDGSYYCQDCGLTIKVMPTFTKDGCTVTIDNSYKFYLNDEVIKEFPSVIESVSHAYEITTEYNENDIIVSMVCKDCGISDSQNIYYGEISRNTGYFDYKFTPSKSGVYCIYQQCEELDGMVALYEMTDGEAILIDFCDDTDDYNADFYIKNYLEANKTYIYRIYSYDIINEDDQTKVPNAPTLDINNDNTNIEYKFYFIIDEVEDIECNNSWQNSNASTKIELFHGAESCKDGLFGVMVCNCCGQIKYIVTANEHFEVNASLHSLEEYVSCGAQYQETSCACGQVSRIMLGHSCESSVDNSYTTIDGKDYTIETYIYECGLKLENMSTYYIDNCTEYYEMTSSLYYLNSDLEYVLITSTTALHESDAEHSFETEYVLLGETCEDGVQYTKICTECGLTESNEINYHEYHDIDFNLSEYNACGGEFRFDKCPCSRRIGDFRDYSDCEYDTEYTSYLDELNRNHEVITKTCVNCGLEYIIDEYKITENCITNEYRYYTIRINNEYLLNNELMEVYTYEGHQVVEDYRMYGETCEDGYEYVLGCKDCNILHSKVSFEHDTKYTNDIYFSDYGACGGYFYSTVCECGENSYHNLSYYSCDYYREYDDYTDEFGILHELYIIRCYRCDLYIEIDSYETFDECVVYKNSYYTIKYGDLVLVEDYFYVSEYFSNHDYEYEFNLRGNSCEDGYTYKKVCKVCGDTDTGSSNYHQEYIIYDIDFEDLGACGGNFEARSCPCGLSNKYYDLNINYCDYNNSSDEYTDENGILHYKETFICSECDLSIVIDSYEEVEGCYTYYYEYISIIYGDTVLVDNFPARYDVSEDHKHTSQYELEGTSCMDGVHVISACENCDYYYENTVYYHYSLYFYDIDFVDYGGCGGYFEAISCPCQEELNYNLNYYSCNYSYESNEYELSNGVQIIDIIRCNDCGLEIIKTNYEIVEGCDIYDYYYFTISIGGTVLVSDYLADMYHTTDHSYTYQYELYGETCEDGLRLIRKCQNCEYSSENEYYYHYTLDLYDIDFEDYGACGGYFNLKSCVCKESMYYNLGYYNCNYYTEYDNYVDGDGYKHETELIRCYDCELSIYLDTLIKEEGCQVEEYVSVSIQCGTNLLVDNEFIDYNMYYNHTYSYDYILNDESCEDGVELTSRCLYCDYYDNSIYYEHVTIEKLNVDLETYGACGGYFKVFTCPCEEELYSDYSISCNYLFNWDSYYDEKDRLHNVTIYTCTDCGLEFTRDNYKTKDECNMTEYNTYTISINGNTLISNYIGYKYNYYEHEYIYSFNLYGESCDDGYDYSAICKYCGEGETNYAEGHVVLRVLDIDLQEYGACGGSFILNQCACTTFSDLWQNFYCDMINYWDNYEDENGINHELYISDCYNCGLHYETDTYTINDGCEFITYQLGTLKVNDNIIFENYILKKSVETYHEYEYTYEMDGYYCTDGYTTIETCVNCDHYETSYSTEHNRRELIYLDLTDYGVCGGYYSIDNCACGLKYSESYCCNFQFNNNIEEIYDEETGLYDYFCELSCSNCPLILEYYQDYVLIGECKYRLDLHMTLSIYGNVLVEDLTTVLGYMDYHQWENTYEFYGDSCEDGCKITSTCLKCEKVLEQTIYEHYNCGEMIQINFKEYGACGGSFIIVSCPCEEAKECYYSVLEFCDFSIDGISKDYTHSDGIFHDFTIYSCFECNLKITEEKTSIYDDNNNLVECTYYTITKGTTVILDRCIGIIGEINYETIEGGIQVSPLN